MVVIRVVGRGCEAIYLGMVYIIAVGTLSKMMTLGYKLVLEFILRVLAYITQSCE